MSPVFLVPYFSGAANYQFPNNWLFVEQEVENYKALPENQRVKYDFIQDKKQAILYNYNYVGLVYLIIVANLILPWLGDVMTLELLQVVSHILISLLIINFYRKKSEKIAFLCLYSLNPLVIYFVTFPYYYYWQVLPAIVILPYLINRKFRYNNLVFAVSAILALGFLVRPATILLILLFFGIYFLIESSWKAVIAFVLFVSMITTFSARKIGNSQTYWHTIFIGIGAYPNPYLKTLSDTEGFDFFRRKTGKTISNTLPGGNLYYDDSIRTLYIETIQSEFTRILQTKPEMFIRNAAFNFFQSFAFGYFVDLPRWVSYLSTLAGLVFIILLLINKQFLWIVAIAAGTLTFTPYYPPIQAYMFGSFILIVGACIGLLQNFNFFQLLPYTFKQFSSKSFLKL